MTNKTQLIAAYERQLKARYGWTQDEEKLNRFMELFKFSINTGAPRSDLANEAFQAAAKEVGLDPNTPLRQLVDLPD